MKQSLYFKLPLTQLFKLHFPYLAQEAVNNTFSIFYNNIWIESQSAIYFTEAHAFCAAT